MNIILAIYHAIPADAWAALLASPVIVKILNVLKKWIDKEPVIITVLVGLCAAAGAVPYFLAAAAANPLILGQYTSVMVGLVTMLYKYGKYIPSLINWLKPSKGSASVTAATAAPSATSDVALASLEQDASDSHVFSVG